MLLSADMGIRPFREWRNINNSIKNQYFSPVEVEMNLEE